MVPDVGPGAKIYSVRKRWGDWVIKVILRILKAYEKIKYGALKADLWRVCILYICFVVVLIF